jgi:membrane associated rhomboid family serine protease
VLDVALIVLLLIVAAIAYRMTTPESRAGVLQTARQALHEAKEAVVKIRSKPDPFRDALRERSPRAPATAVLASLNAAIFIFMLFGAGSFGDPQTLLSWGANLGPRTTNGEWWRLVTSMFVHSGMFLLLLNMAALIQVGPILERLFGRVMFASVYVLSGIFASLVSLWVAPVVVTVGAAGAMFGLYGMLVAWSLWSLIGRSELTIAQVTVRRLAPTAMLFFLFNLVSQEPGIVAELAGFMTGFACGLLLSFGIGDGQPSPRRIARLMAAPVVIALLMAFLLRGIADVRSEIARVVAVEDHTAGLYRAATERSRKGLMSAEALSQLIDRTIVPELQAADGRLKALKGVPSEHEGLVADAEEYLRLRSESWRLRADALRKTNVLPPRQVGKTENLSDASWRMRAEAQYKTTVMTLGRAESAERASLVALEKIKPAGSSTSTP